MQEVNARRKQVKQHRIICVNLNTALESIKINEFAITLQAIKVWIKNRYRLRCKKNVYKQSHARPIFRLSFFRLFHKKSFKNNANEFPTLHH